MRNLRRALFDKNISIKAYADFLGVTVKTAQNKLNEKSEFTFSEAVKTKVQLLPEYDLQYLFANDRPGVTEYGDVITSEELK